MRLGELLLEEKLITADALEEGLESQVVHGGRLGTNLVELGLVSEEDVARLRSWSCEAAQGSRALTAGTVRRRSRFLKGY